MTSRRFTAKARRSEGWWAVEVTGDDLPYPAYTQARRLEPAKPACRDAGPAADCFANSGGRASPGGLAPHRVQATSGPG
jgi:hypothetical protein